MSDSVDQNDPPKDVSILITKILFDFNDAQK